MKKGMKITAAILVIALVAALICTGLELKSTREELLKAEAQITILEIDNALKTADNIRLDAELAKEKAEQPEVQQ